MTVPTPLTGSHWLSTLLVNFVYQYDIFVFFYKIFKFFLRHIFGSSEMHRIVAGTYQKDLVTAQNKEADSQGTFIMNYCEYGLNSAEISAPQFKLTRSSSSTELQALTAFHRIEPAKRKIFLYRLGI
jgi:hypothetical protein